MTESRWRPEVVAFADAMECKLRQNDYRRGWQDCPREYLLIRLSEEVGELNAAVRGRICVFDAVGYAYQPPRTDTVLGEAADVANFAMMLADVCGVLKSRDPERVRGRTMRDETAVERAARINCSSVADRVDCYFCQGTGWIGGWPQPRCKCRNCHGHGWNVRQKPSASAQTDEEDA